MASAAQRQAPRVDVELDVTLQTVDGDVPCQTRDASYQGVFIVQSDPLPLRKLIRFKTRLPDSDRPLQMLGLVAHTVNASEAAEQDRDPGMGIQLFSLGEETRRQWRDFLDARYQQDPEARQTLESSRRPTIRMRLADEATLEDLRTDHLPRRRLFVRTPDLHPEGTDVDLVLNHPTVDATAVLEATVAESVEGSVTDRGLELDLELSSDRSDLEAFVGGSIPEDPAPESPPRNGRSDQHTPPPAPDEENQQ